MGLDMYLTAKVYISPYDHAEERELRVRTSLQKIFNTKLIPEGVEFRVMYWRKANAIHKWFVDNVQDGKDDCGTYYVSDEQLLALIHTCKKALAEYEKPNGKPEIHEILPTQSGFFFGNTEYDDYYRDDLKETIEGLTKFLASEESKTLDVYYHSSW